MNYLILIQTMIAAIHTVEALMPDSPGKDKFNAALAIVEGIIGDVKAQQPALEKLATTVVNALRLLGVFKVKTA